MKCRCGQPAHRRELVIHGSAYPVPMCDACWTKAVDGFDAARAEFDALIADGVHPRMANRIMMVRHSL